MPVGHLKGITSAAHSPDQVRAEGSKRAADVSDMDVHGTGFDLNMRGPAARDEIVSLADNRGRLQKAAQQPKL